MSKFSVTIKTEEDDYENNITIERSGASDYITSSEIMRAVLDAMKGLTYHLKYEEDLEDMIDDSDPNLC